MKNIQPQLADIPTEARLNQKAAKPTYALTSVASTMSSSKTSRWGPSQDLCDFIPPEDDARYRLSFWQAFGLLGIPILLLLGICLSWTLWLMLLTVAPNGIANLLMKTAEYDSGLFWLIVEDPVAIQVASIVGLTGIELYYVYILAKVLVWRTVEAPLVRALSRHKAKMALLFKPSRVAASDKATTPLREMWTELTGFHGKHRKFWNLLLKAVDLVVETVALQGFLSDGFPPVLIYCWAGFVCVNSLSCALNILVLRSSALKEVIVDSLFDLVAAVGFPLLVLMYCQHHFDFDHEVIALFKRTIRPNSFDDMGRLFANQAQIALFRVIFDSLRIQTLLDLFVRISMNLSFCSRFHAVVVALVRIHRRTLYPRRPTSFRVRVPTPVPKPTAIIFIVFSALVVAYTHVAIRSSWTACNAYPECVVYTHRFPWTASSTDLCPCQAMIDEDRFVVVWEQWENHADVTEKVEALAAAGELRILRLINRKLVTLPDVLRSCTSLRHLALVHTLTTELPDWAGDWTGLEYLHMEGQPGGSSLQYLPRNLFHNMPSLTLIHLASHPMLDRLPAFDGTPVLRSLVLADLPLLHALPLSFDQIPGVTQLVLFDLPQLQGLPDMAPLSRLAEFSLIKPSHLCCNGFLASCDQDDAFCAADLERNIPRAQCSDSSVQATEATRQVFRNFADTTCHEATFLTGMADPPTRERTEMCAYTFFKRCEYPPNSGQTGMCMPYRMRVLSCTLNERFIDFRRQEIHDLGMQCNPVVESWLGCTY